MIPSDGDGLSTFRSVLLSISNSSPNTQIPLLAISGVLIYLKVDYEIALNPGSATPTKETPRQKLARIDFLGCFLLAGFVGALLLAVSIKTSSIGDDEIGWSDPLIVGLFGASGGLFLVFLLVEFKFAKEPVLPLELLHRRTAVSVAIHNLVLSILIYAMVSPLYNINNCIFTDLPAVQCTPILYSCQPHVGIFSREPHDTQRFLRSRRFLGFRLLDTRNREVLLVNIPLWIISCSQLGNVLFLDKG
jgi:hypothetical protein